MILLMIGLLWFGLKLGLKRVGGLKLVNKRRRRAADELAGHRRTAKRGNGEGGVYQRDGDGRWCAAITLSNGRKRVIYGGTRQEVADKLSDLLSMKKQGYPLGPDRLTVAVYMLQWLEESAKPKLKPSTYCSYGRLISGHIIPALGKHTQGQTRPAACPGVPQ